MRAAAEMESKVIAELLAGTVMTVLEQRTLPNGTKRARVALKSDIGQVRRGWVSLIGKDGAETLLSA